MLMKGRIQLIISADLIYQSGSQLPICTEIKVKRSFVSWAHISVVSVRGNVNLFLIGTCVLWIDYEAIVKLSDGFNGADLRNVCTEAGILLIINFDGLV